MTLNQARQLAANKTVLNIWGDVLTKDDVDNINHLKSFIANYLVPPIASEYVRIIANGRAVEYDPE